MPTETTFRGYTKSNRFRVKDRETFVKLMSKTVTDGSRIHTTIHDNGMVSFYVDGAILGIPTEKSNQPDGDAFRHAIRELVIDDNVCMFTEVLNDERMMTGFVNIITPHLCARLDIDYQAKLMARDLLQNQHWEDNR